MISTLNITSNGYQPIVIDQTARHFTITTKCVRLIPLTEVMRSFRVSVLGDINYFEYNIAFCIGYKTYAGQNSFFRLYDKMNSHKAIGHFRKCKS